MASNTGANGAFVEGCFTKARDQILVHTEAVGGVTLAILIIMVINLILSLILCTCGFDNEDDARPRKGAYTQARQDRIWVNILIFNILIEISSEYDPFIVLFLHPMKKI